MDHKSIKTIICHHRLWGTKAQVKEIMSTGFDYIDEDGTEVKAINPTQEIPKETNPSKVIVMIEILISSCKAEKRSRRAKVYLVVV